MAFSELLVILVVGLLVLGPERLPAAVRTVSLWVGRLRRSFYSIRDEFEREIGADEIRRQLHNENVMNTFKDAERDLSESVGRSREQLRDMEYDISDIVSKSQEPQENQPPRQNDAGKPDETDH